MIRTILLVLGTAGVIWFTLGNCKPVESQPVQVSQTLGSDEMKLSSGSYVAIAEPAKEEETTRLLLLGAFAKDGPGIYRGILVGLSAAEVDRLRRQYGDFRRCDAGAKSDVISAARQLHLVPQDDRGLAALSEIEQATKAGQDVWVEVVGRHLDVRMYAWRSHPVNQVGEELESYLVKSLARVAPPKTKTRPATG